MEQRREHQRSEQKVAASALRVNTEKRVSTQGGKELRRKHGRSDQDASRGKREKVAEMVERGKVEKLAEKVESDWAKEMRHMFGKIRHRLKRHRDRARSPPRHRWNSSLSAQTVSQEEASRSQSTTLPSRTVSPSSKSQTASPCSQVFSSPALADSVRSQVSSFADSSTISSRQIVTISGGDSKSLRYPSTNPSTTLDRGDTISLPLLSVSQESGNPQKTLFEGEYEFAVNKNVVSNIWESSPGTISIKETEEIEEENDGRGSKGSDQKPFHKVEMGQQPNTKVSGM